jgi:CxxC motif-containing protein (DUF1111 family)
MRARHLRSRPSPPVALLRAAAAALLAAACGEEAPESPAPDSTLDESEAFAGGEATVFDASRMAFAHALPALSGEREDEFFVGNAIFNRGWVTAPASVSQFDGLGPLFNATNCSACHLKDGRGRPPETPDESFLSLLLRLSVPGTDARGAPLPEPSYGGQLQGSAVLGVEREGRERVTYTELPGAFADGEAFSLRVPSYAIEELAYGALSPEAMLSPRVAPAVFGLGLLAAVPDATLEALADPEDRDGDGISGRVNPVWDVRRGALAVGRFGWKASRPTLEQQTAGAFLGDMGITSSLFPDEACTPNQPACALKPSGATDGQPELADGHLAGVSFYMHTLAVPGRRRWRDPEVLRGKQVFFDAGCAGCHVPEIETGELESFPELSHQRIRPYTDLLLHDMGPDLADRRPDHGASGSEWRTPPLWGIGLVEVVNRHAYFLHDGRARGLLEAVLWHGGEAARSRDLVRELPRDERVALISFLSSL